jgi:hypothetical protein
MQIGGECIQYLLVNMLLEKKLIHKFEKTPFHASSLGNERNSNLELSNVQQLKEPKVILLKPASMNHHH